MSTAYIGNIISKCIRSCIMYYWGHCALTWLSTSDWRGILLCSDYFDHFITSLLKYWVAFLILFIPVGRKRLLYLFHMCPVDMCIENGCGKGTIYIGALLGGLIWFLIIFIDWTLDRKNIFLLQGIEELWTLWSLYISMGYRAVCTLSRGKQWETSWRLRSKVCGKWITRLHYSQCSCNEWWNWVDLMISKY